MWVCLLTFVAAGWVAGWRVGPGWAITVGLLALGLRLSFLFVRRVKSLLVQQRRDAGLCPSCGYDLRATPGRCPECGTAGVSSVTG